MIFITSPAKTLDFESDISPQIKPTSAEFKNEVNTLVENFKKLPLAKLKATFDVSDKLAEQNYQRFQEWETATERAAIFAYQGDIYQQFAAKEFSKKQADYLQSHLRIISGLYGLVRPYDKIKPYRLEMKTALDSLSGLKEVDLYEFWGNKLTDKINKDLEEFSDELKMVINLASNEYVKAIDQDEIAGKWVDIEFRQRKNGEIKNYGIYAKKARGKFIKFAAENFPKNIKDLEKFDLDGYQFSEKQEENSVIKMFFITNV